MPAADDLPIPPYAAPLPERGAVDRATFERDVLGAGGPVVLRGQVADWPAVRAATGPAATRAYLGAFGATEPVETMIGPPAIAGRFFYNDDLTGFNFTKRALPLDALMDTLVAVADDPEPPALYAGAAAAPTAAPGFTAANPMPLLDADVLARVWIGNAGAVSTHNDLSANIACVVAGRRRFTLFPPERVGDLYVGPLDLTMAGRPVSMVDPDAPDLRRHPRFAQAMPHARAAVLEPGDVIFMPALWWHQVRSHGAFNVLVNYWWGQPADSPFDALVHALLAVRDRPAAERRAWRAFFDHYLFQDEVDPAAHLPEGGRGVLGPASPARSRRIREYLAQALARAQAADRPSAGSGGR